jgi:molecular chaperone DnaK (HSP70)
MKINVDEAVANGATIQGAIIKVENNIEELIIKDINLISI